MDATANTETCEELTRVFVSYAREDKRWLDRNDRHNLIPFLMESLKRQNVVFWYDKELRPGDEFRSNIEAEIDRAQIALLIVSQNFLNSEFIEQQEMPRIANRARQGQMVIVPVLAEPCDWNDFPILADRQMVPGPMPLIDYTESEPAWVKVRAEILDGLKTQIKRIREKQEVGHANRAPVGMDQGEARQKTPPRGDDLPGEIGDIPTSQPGDLPQRKSVEPTPAPTPIPVPQPPFSAPAPRKTFFSKLSWEMRVILGLAVAAVVIVIVALAVKKRPPAQSPDSLYKEGDSALSRGDYAKALDQFNKACDAGSAISCVNLGYMYENGQGVAKDDSRAAALYSEGCDAGNALGCVNLGILYKSGKGVAKDDSHAAALFTKGCDAGNARGCTNLGYMYENGQSVGKDDSRAATLYSEGCDAGNALGCVNLGYMYEKGKGVTKDDSHAVALYSEGCDAGNARGCSNLGNHYRFGLGVAKNVVKARQLLTKGCSMGNQWGCDQLKEMQ
jgi:hypothetical protein